MDFLDILDIKDIEMKFTRIKSLGSTGTSILKQVTFFATLMICSTLYASTEDQSVIIKSQSDPFLSEAANCLIYGIEQRGAFSIGKAICLSTTNPSLNSPSVIIEFMFNEDLQNEVNKSSELQTRVKLSLFSYSSPIPTLIGIEDVKNNNK